MLTIRGGTTADRALPDRADAGSAARRRIRMSFDTQLHDVDLAEVARARVEIRHVRGASDATYLINAFGEELLMKLQLNVHRLVVVYRVPALDALDARTLAVRLERWRIGAEAPAPWCGMP